MKSAKKGPGDEESARPSPAGFQRKSVLIENPRRSAEKAQRIRTFLLHDNHSRVLGLIMRSPRDQEAVAELLTDRFAGIGPLAAGEFLTAAHRRMDIERAVPKLTEALASPYTRTDAAHALARHFLNIGDNERLDSLLAHPEPEVVRAAHLVLMHEATKEER